MKFSAERIAQFASNVNSNVRGIDLAIDYSHNAADEAAGWIRKAESRSNGLWLFVEWTKGAAQRIRDKEFRYFSAEFVDEWVSSGGEKFQDVILGGGLTNRPFLKDLLPVNLSELYEKGKDKEDESMELKELQKALGLSEDADEAKALEAIKLLSESVETITKELDELKKEPVKEPVEDPAKKLAEEDPIVKALVDEVAQLRAESTLADATRLTEIWSSPSTDADRKFALPPAVNKQLSDILVGGNQELTKSLTEVMDHILKNGLVTFKEDGTLRPSNKPEEDNSASAEFTARVKKLQDDTEGLSFADAYSEVSNDEELYDRYRKETMSGVITEEVTE
jgi:hypothetical protein